MVRTISALAAVFSVASASLAADLATPVVFVGSVGVAVVCRITNITSSSVPVQVQIVEADNGAVVSDTGTQSLPPGQTLMIGVPNPNNYAYCRFVRASKSKVRGALAVFGPPNSDRLVVEAQ